MFTYERKFNGGNYWLSVFLYGKPVGIIREHFYPPGYYYTSLKNPDLGYPVMNSPEAIQHYLERGLNHD